MGKETALGKHTSSPACSSEIQIFIKPPYIHFFAAHEAFLRYLVSKEPSGTEAACKESSVR